MPMTQTFKSSMLTAVLITNPLITHIGLMNGESEISGGSPAYARKAVTWTAASGGPSGVTSRPSSDLTFDIPPGATVNRWAGFNASSGGTNYGGGALTSEAFAAQGQYKLLAASTGISASDS